MDQQLIDGARLAVWVLHDQTQPDATPDATPGLALALNKLVVFGKAINAEHFSESEAAALVRNVCSPLRKAENGDNQ